MMSAVKDKKNKKFHALRTKITPLNNDIVLIMILMTDARTNSIVETSISLT